MIETKSEQSLQTDWRKLHAFGLPAGSIRALMALMVFGALWVFVVLKPNEDVPEYLRDILFIILGHYFAVRGRASADAEPGPPPLYLPNGSVRFLLMGGFAVTALLLHRQGRLLAISENPAVVTLLLAVGFMLGVLVRQVAGKLMGQTRSLPRFVEDCRALISLAAAVFLVVVVWDRIDPGMFHTLFADMKIGVGRIGLPQIAATVVGFYFGSRS